MPKDYSLASINERLKAAYLPVSVQRRGKRLVLQATLPPKPVSKKRGRHQQQITLGLPSNDAGRRRAEGLAIQLGGEIIAGSFTWDKYSTGRMQKAKLCGEIVRAFETDYRSRNEIKNTTWVNGWEKVLKLLPPDQPLSEKLILNVVLSKRENTSTRLEVCRKLQALAKFSGLNIDLSPYQGNYGNSKVKRRDLPDDALISKWFDQIPNPGWQWIYGVIAAYGVRPHEAFFSRFSSEGLEVVKGKTGPRIVYQAFYPEWVDRWNLTEIKLPGLDAEKAYHGGRLGKAVANQFRRYKVPFPPYDLRHAWAIRSTVLFGVPETVSAQLMGHSPIVHMAEYQRWIGISRGKDVIARIMEANQPAAPN